MSEGILRLPRLGETMEQGRIVAWVKQPGESFRRGETLLEVETDKTVVEMPALADGTLVAILAEPGAEVAVDAPIARVTGAAASPDGEVATEARPVPVSAPTEASGLGRPAAAAAAERHALRATPAARRAARERGMDIAALRGSGPRGRIEARDVEAQNVEASALAGPKSDAIAIPGGALAWRRWPARGAVRAEALLLHGFAADAGTWIEIAPLLTEAGIGCQALDLSAHGTSRHEAETFEAVAGATEAAMAALPIAPDLLIGHSLGALVAAELALRRPAGLRGLLLLAPAGMGAEIDADLLARLATAGTPEALDLLLRRLGGRLPPPPAAVLETVVRQNRSHPGLEALAADLAGPPEAPGQRHSLPARLERIEAPVVAVIGRDDRVVPWEQALNLPPAVALHLLPGVGHVPHWEAPDLVARLAARLAGF